MQGDPHGSLTFAQDLTDFACGQLARDSDDHVKGKDLVYFAAWKYHLSLYPVPAMDEALERELAPYRAATSTLRFPFSKPVPYDLIRRLAELHVRQAGGQT